MSNHRMFANAIVNSGKFLRMPPTTRLLYYDLGMAADDEGVVEAFTVMRSTGATEDDLRVLVAKGFVKILNEELVTLITDWNTNNIIRKDRFHESIYHELLISLGDTWVTDGCQPGDNWGPEVKLSKDKSSKSKLIEGKAPKRFTPPTLEEVKAYCAERRNTVDAERFIDYYTSIGWAVGKTRKRMKDWKAAVRYWEDKPKKAPEKVYDPDELPWV